MSASVPTLGVLQAIAAGMAGSGYAAARRSADRTGEPAHVSAVALLAAGLAPPEVRTLFQIATRLRRHHEARCNRPLRDGEEAAAENDERLAHHILTYKVMPEGPPVRRSTVQEIELTGLPGGAAIKVRLLTTSGDVIGGNDFGDSRFICI